MTGAPALGTDRPLRTVSLRRRVTAWVLVLLLASLTITGLVVNWLLGNALRSDLQQRLEDKAGYAAVLQEQGVTGQTLADRLAGNGVVSLFTAGGRQYVGREQTPAVPPAGKPGPRSPKPTPAELPRVTFGESAGRLTATVSLPDGTLTLSTTENDITNALSRLRQIEVVVGAVTVLATGVALALVVRAALRPLERMSELARRIRAGARGRRLRPTKPGTDIGRTAVALDDMLDALEAAEAQASAAQDRMRQFLADASHDLRTPLAGVIAGAEQLLRTPTSRADREDRLVQVVRQARRAARLVDDLLLITRLDAADPADERTGAPARDRQEVDPAVLLEREVDFLRLRRPDLRFELALDRGAVVLADPDQLQRALGNVLENAAGVTPPSGRVTVVLRRNEGAVRIQVQDSGPGVPAGDRERIFDRFVRLSTSRSGPGSGLGLPISRAILRADGGDLRCVPSEAGACFEAVLPPITAPRRDRGIEAAEAVAGPAHRSSMASSRSSSR